MNQYNKKRNAYNTILIIKTCVQNHMAMMYIHVYMHLSYIHCNGAKSERDCTKIIIIISEFYIKRQF